MQCTAFVEAGYETNNSISLSLTIVEGEGDLMSGLDWVPMSPFNYPRLFKVEREKCTNKVILADFEDVSGYGLGQVKGSYAPLCLETDVQPKFFPPRTFPFVLKTAVQQELHKLKTSEAWERDTC